MISFLIIDLMGSLNPAVQLLRRYRKEKITNEDIIIVRKRKNRIFV